MHTELAKLYKTTPKKGEYKVWEDMIVNREFDKLFEEDPPKDPEEPESASKVDIRGDKVMPQSYLKFVYAYTVHCANKSKLEGWLSEASVQASNDCHVFARLTPSDEAWAVAVIVNGWDGWCDKFEYVDDKKNKIHRKNLGRWTANKKPRDVNGKAVDTKKSHGRFAYKDGWVKEGKEFYEKANVFFEDARRDPRHAGLVTRAKNMWEDELDRKYRLLGALKRKRAMYEEDEEDDEEGGRVLPPLMFDGKEALCEFRNYTAV